MFAAKIKNGLLFSSKEADKNIDYFCPGCDSSLIFKKGIIKTPHFSYKSADCDSWSEGETIWHLKWKELVPLKNREVVIKNHRADIKLDNGLVIELQNSPISFNEILEREIFYKNMIWVKNGIPIIDNFIIREKEKYVTFIWKWGQKSWSACGKPFYIDFGIMHGILEVKKIYFKNGVAGWGYLLSRDEFYKKFNLNYMEEKNEKTIF